MAGASGGRKTIVPGLIGEHSTQVFHGPRVLSSPYACDLQLDGNPCHEESLEGAKIAGADFILNVTLDGEFRLTGVYAGDLEAAHRLAVEELRRSVGIPLNEPYDVVITHAGRVGINHYQAAKAAVVGARAARPGGYLIIAGHHPDIDPVGSMPYRSVLHILKMIGHERFDRLLLSPDWSFVHDQWEPQMWSKVLATIPDDHLYYCATGLTERDYEVLPGRDGQLFLPETRRYGTDPGQLAAMVEGAAADAISRFTGRGAGQARIAYLADGPYGIPLLSL